MHILWGQPGLGHRPHLFTKISNFAPPPNSRFTQQKHAISAFAKRQSLKQKKCKALHNLINARKCFSSRLHSTEEKYEQQSNYKCRLVLDMGFSSLSHSPHRRLSYLFQTCILETQQFVNKGDSYMFGLSHRLLTSWWMPIRYETASPAQ